jgi:hypothetical protein
MPDKPNPYQAAADVLLAETGCTVRKWRQNMAGRAFTRADDWGIEVPEPRGAISFGVFAHEVGHQLLHRHNSAPRWLEELQAWEYALAQFDRFELAGKHKAREDAAKSLVWAAAKTEKRCSPETAQKLLDHYPEWVWSDSSRAMTYLDVAIKAGEA